MSLNYLVLLVLIHTKLEFSYLEFMFHHSCQSRRFYPWPCVVYFDNTPQRPFCFEIYPLNSFATKRDALEQFTVHYQARLESRCCSKFSIDVMQQNFPLFFTPFSRGITPELSPILLTYKTRLFIGLKAIS